MRIAPLFPLLLMACGVASEHKELQDRGELCVAAPGMQPSRFAEPADRMLPADQRVEVSVAFNGCLGSSCDRDREATCNVTVAGNVITVESRLSWTHLAGGCTDDCGLLAATCTTEPLPAGTYTLKHGDQSATIVVGGQNPPCPDITH